jgi:hypothetical protein
VHVLLRIELIDEFANRGLGNQFVRIAMQHEAATGTRSEEAKVVVIGRRRDADPAGNLRPAHQQLHADEGTERVAGDARTH